MATLAYPLPQRFPVTRAFAARGGIVNHLQIGPHTGIDLGAPTGTPVLAAGAGTVTRAGYVDAYGGRMVYISHDDGHTETRYAHLSAVTVRAGQHVGAGQQVGNVGSSGAATGPHLHFEVIQHGSPVCGLVAQGGLCFEDPAAYIDTGTGGSPDKPAAQQIIDAILRDPAWAGAKQIGDVYVAVPDALPGCPARTHPLVYPTFGNPAASHVCGVDNFAGLPGTEGQSAAQLISLAIPPLLEPALSIAVVVAGVVLIYQGFREVLAG